MKAVLYIRVSTEEQALEGYSLEAQKNKGIEYCNKNGYEIVGIYIDEGISAKNLNRPEAQRLLEDVTKKKFDVVVVYKLNRLSRRLKDLTSIIELFLKYNVQIKSTMEDLDISSLSGRLMIQILGVLAEYDLGSISENVVMGMHQRAREGHYTASRVLGYDYDKATGIFSINEEEAKIVRLIFELNSKSWGCVRIARHLNELGYKTKDGNTFANNSINYMLNHAWYYCGKFMYKPKGREPELLVAKNIPNPIFTEEEFLYFKKIKNANYSTAKKWGTDAFTFKRRLHCICGSPFITYSTNAGRGDKIYRYYKCRKNSEGRCSNAYAHRNERIDEEFLNFLKTYAEEDKSITLQRSLERLESLKSDLDLYKNKLDKEQNRKKKLQLLLLDGDISKEDYESLSLDIHDSIKTTEENITHIEEEISKQQEVSLVEKEKELALMLADIWEDITQAEKRELISKFVKKIIYSDKIEKVEFII